MRYDNPEIKDIIDRCVEKIMQEDDKQFLSHPKWEDCWIWLLSYEIYEALLPDPSYCHDSLEVAARFLEQTYAEGTATCTFPSWKELQIRLPLTRWGVYLYDAPRGKRFSISMDNRHLAGCGNTIPTGFLLTIDCHFPYIREKVHELMWEYKRRTLIKEIGTIAKEYGMI